MSRKQTFGLSDDAYIIATTAVSGTTPIVSRNQAGTGIAQFDTVGLQLVTTSTAQGSWKVEISNNSVDTATGGAPYGQAQNASPQWSDVTSIFSPAITTVTTASNLATQANLCFRAFRVTFTPTSGAGSVTCIAFAKSNS